MPCAAELVAILRGSETAVEKGWGAVLVETNCLEAVLMVIGNEECLAEEGLLVDKNRPLLTHLKLQGISYIPRVANGAAHEVAHFVSRKEGHYIWLGVRPVWLMDVILMTNPNC